MLLAEWARKKRLLVVFLSVGFVACGDGSSSPDGGGGASGGAAAGRGGTGGAAGGGGTVGATGGAAGGGGTAGATGGGSGSGAAGTTGGTSGRGGTGATGGGPAGASGTAGGGGAGGGGNAGRGGAAGTAGAAGAGGGAGRGGGGGGAGGSGNAGGAGAAGTGGTLGGRCTAPAECSGTPPGSTFCTPTWSCVAGTCVAECVGGRTCTEAPSSGCLLCRTETSTTPMSQGCVGTACAFDVARIADVEPSTSCQASQTPSFSTWLCTGQWATVGVGGAARICTIQLLPTALVRYSVSCGACVTIVTLN